MEEINISNPKQIKYENTHRVINGFEEKFCLKCDSWYPCTLEYFHKNKYNKDGLLTYCKECQSNKEKIKYWKNPDPKRAYQRIANVSPKGKERAKKVSEERKTNGYWKEYYEKNPEQWRKYREDRKHKNHDITDNEWMNCKVYFNNECAYCGLHISEHFIKYAGEFKWTDFHKEHVDDEGENDLSNCIPSCKYCNCQKWMYSLIEWYNEDNKAYTYERLENIYKWLKEDHKKYLEN